MDREGPFRLQRGGLAPAALTDAEITALNGNNLGVLDLFWRAEGLSNPSGIYHHNGLSAVQVDGEMITSQGSEMEMENSMSGLAYNNFLLQETIIEIPHQIFIQDITAFCTKQVPNIDTTTASIDVETTNVLSGELWTTLGTVTFAAARRTSSKLQYHDVTLHPSGGDLTASFPYPLGKAAAEGDMFRLTNFRTTPDNDTEGARKFKGFGLAIRYKRWI